jgi:hypothetical protein
MLSENELKELSKVAGVDFNALRNKYKKQQGEQGPAQVEVLSENTYRQNLVNEEDKKKISDPSIVNEMLDKYNICKNCQGLGTIKTIYNFMTLESTCEECDGESIVMKSKVDEIIRTERMDR